MAERMQAPRPLFVVVGGFLGAGKTTALTRMAGALEAVGKRTALIMNDQGEGLVDTAFGEAAGLRVAEVTGGCFCCRFDDLASTVATLMERGPPDVILAEAVGSCTDLTATVTRPLRAYAGNRIRVAPLTVLVEPARLRELLGDRDATGRQSNGPMAYLFRTQLEDARVLVLTKTDLLSDPEERVLTATLQRSFPGAEVLAMAATTGRGAEVLRDRWLGTSAHGGEGGEGDVGLRAIDYGLYARAEAELAWLNAEVSVLAPEPQDAVPWLRTLLAAISDRCDHQALWIGHAKAQLITPDGAAKASVLRAGDPAAFDLQSAPPFARARLLLNARVRARPAELEAIVREGITETDARMGTASTLQVLRCFSPPPPRPTHRLPTLPGTDAGHPADAGPTRRPADDAVDFGGGGE